ncbi:MAG: DUF218 domain-containing protein [Bacteroidia bacterium]|nr:YdcF family protein [Bacteroidia bacterium]NNM16105.1 DUF218 domain-containing protein [Bacteroidia bacterium]
MRFIRFFVIQFICLAALLLAIYYEIQSDTKDQIYSEIKDLPAYRFAFVLGAGSNQTFAPENFAFTNRMKAAKQLAKNHGPLEKIIVSGWKDAERYNEPYEMKKYLVQHGIDSNFIETDYAGKRTFSSILHASNKYPNSELIIISQRELLERAIYLAKNMGITCVGFEAKKIEHLSGTKLFFRELFAKLKCMIDLTVYRFKNL